MAKKKIEEMNEQELAAEKAASSVEVVDNATEAKTEHPMLRTEVKETLNVAPIAGGTVNEQGQTVAAPLNKNVQMSVDTRTAKQKRQETNAGNFLNALEAKEQELGRELTMQEIADFGDAKGLWAYQALNNKKGNWGDAFGGNELFGRMNKNTYDMIRKDLNSRATAKQAKDAEDNHWNKEIAIVPMGDGLLRINKKMQTEMKNWGSQITDPNYITPEQAKQLYATLNSYGIETPEVTGHTTLGALIDNIDDEAADVMQALGFYDNGFNQVTLPKNETFEEIMARREKAEEAMRLQSQQRALERQRARTGLADLAAGIGDMIKASNGAIVTPRDYQAMYDTLTAQQKVNYNNYLARMQAMKEAEKAKAKEAADRAYQERLLTEQRAYQEEQARKAQEFQAAENEKNRKHQEAMLSDKLEAQRAIQQMKNDAAIGKLFMNLQSKEAMQSAKYGDSIPYGGSIIPIAMNKSDALYQGIYGLIETTIRNHPAYVNELASIDEAYLETNPERVRVIVASALTNPSVVLPPEINEKIQQYINDAKALEESKDKKGRTGTVSQVTGSANFITPASNYVASNTDSAVNISILGNNIMNQLQSQ